MTAAQRLNRRDFLRTACYTGLGLASAWSLGCAREKAPEPGKGLLPNSQPEIEVPGLQHSSKAAAKAQVFVVKTTDRKEGVRRCLEMLAPLSYAGKQVLVKPNFNTADPAPGSTHYDTLEQLLVQLQAARPASLAVGERSGPPLTRDVIQDKGIPDLCQRLGVGLINYDDLNPQDWVPFQREGLHWQDGFRVARPVREADINVATCCLKTHAYGGVFSMSLKLAVGLVPRRGYTYMQELHSSPDIRKMIAEINLAYSPDFILMDGVEVFVDGGPDRGVRKKANLFLLSRDRVALDAVGLAVLKDLGSNAQIMQTPIFQQEQLARAVELGLGIAAPTEIELVSDTKDGTDYALRLTEILKIG